MLDEIHDMLTPIYFNFAKNNLIGTNIARIGLTATIDTKTKYEQNNEEINKVDLLNQFCPIIYTYSINQGQEDKTSREINLFILNHNLAKEKTIETGTKTKKWLTTELDQYHYYDKEFKKSLFLPHNNKSREFLIRAAASRKHN